MRKKAIIANIYKHSGHSCSNGGISERYDYVYILHDDGVVDVDLDNPPENLCVLIEKDFGFNKHKFVIPYGKSNGLGWMYGGSIVYISDARFESEYPLCLHDRQETYEQYEQLSH